MNTPVAKEHLDELHASRISDDVIRAAGVRSVTPQEATELLGWKNCRSGGLAFPYYDLAGREIYARLKLDASLKGRKYESPKGCRQQLYLPPPAWELFQAGKDPIVFVEGEKKALCLASLGYAAIGLPGVYLPKKAKKKDSGPQDALLENIPIRGRRVVIAFDSDVASNSQVANAVEKLVVDLITAGADVLVAKIPAGPRDAKQGIDDFLAAADDDAAAAMLQELVTEAEIEKLVNQALARQGDDKQEKIPAAVELAEEFLHSQHAGHHPTLRRYRDEFHHWKGAHFEPISEEDVEAQVFSFMTSRLKAKERTPRLCKTITQCVRYRTWLDSSRESPFWISGDERGPNREFITLTNGIFDLEAAFRGELECLRPLTPNWFSPISLTFPFDVNADCPRWRAFLDQMLQGDRQLIQLLQLWFGYCLVPDVSLQKALLLVGDGSNGKSIILHMLVALLGLGNVSAVQLENFGERFALAPTVGKLANVIPEVGELDKVAEGVLKGFVVGDLLTIDRKNRAPLQTHPTARLVLATNRLPRFTDRTDGIWRRLIVIPFDVQIPITQQDPHLKTKLEAELSGVFNWALIGLYMLRQAQRFPETAAGAAALAEYRLECNPTAQFFQEHVVADNAQQIECSKLYGFYRWWMNEQGYRPLGSGQFGKEVSRTFGAPRIRPTINGVRQWAYEGVRPIPHPNHKL